MTLPENPWVIVLAIAQALLAIFTWLNGRKSDRNGKQIREVHLTMNSRLDQLVASTKEASRAEGHAAGLIEGKKEQSVSDSTK